jgi:hypothetical protein
MKYAKRENIYFGEIRTDWEAIPANSGNAKTAANHPGNRKAKPVTNNEKGPPTTGKGPFFNSQIQMFNSGAQNFYSFAQKPLLVRVNV